MIDPKMTKLAASRGVGAMIVAHILKDNESFSTRGEQQIHLLQLEWRVNVW